MPAIRDEQRPSPNQPGNFRREEWEAAVEEFRALRAELTVRIEKQQDITNFAIVTVAAFFTIVKATQGSLTVIEALERLRGFIPFASIAFSAFTLMALDHEMNIAHLSLYIHKKLRTRMTMALAGDLQQSAFAWNAYRATWQQHAGWATPLTTTMASAKYVMTILPNVALLGAYWHHLAFHTVSIFEWIAYVGACAVLVLTLGAATYTSRAYMQMPHAGKGLL